MKISAEILDEIRAEVQKVLENSDKLPHTLAVEAEVVAICEGLGYYGLGGINTLRAAALLHDVTKNLTYQEQLDLCAEYGIELGEEEKKSPKILHAITGAEKARKMFGDLIDDEIYNCIRYHTTGKPDMNLSEKIIYLADYIEPTRKFEGCVRLREFYYGAEKFTEAHLNEVLIMSHDMTVSSLIKFKEPIYKMTVESRNYLINRTPKKNQRRK